MERSKSWTAEELQTLTSLAGKKTAREISTILGRTYEGVRKKAARLNICLATYTYINGARHKHGIPKGEILLNEQQKSLIRKHFPTSSCDEVAELVGISGGSLYKYAHMMGISKDAQYKRDVKRKAARMSHLVRGHSLTPKKKKQKHMKKNQDIKILLGDGAIMPKKEFPNSIGYDLYIPTHTYVKKGRQIIPLNFRIALPDGIAMLIFARSGSAAKGVKGYTDKDKEQRYPLCSLELGLVDPGYRGNVGLILDNQGEGFHLHKGDSIAQCMFIPVPAVNLLEAQSLDETDRGSQGFNS